MTSDVGDRSRRPLTILLVEDNSAEARLIELTLAEANVLHRMSLLGTLSDALEWLSEDNDADAALLDLGLPDANGLVVVDRVRKIRPSLPIVVVTGRNDDELGLEAIERGADDYLPKDDISSRDLVRSMRFAIERRRHHEELEEARRKAEEGSRARSLFLASMSHELRTPLTSILGYTELLLQRCGTDQCQRGIPEREFVAVAHRNGLHLLELISNMLEFVRIEVGGRKFTPQCLDVEAQLEESIEMVKGLADGKGVELALEVQPGIGHVKLDPTAFRQMVFNLLSNAIKFAPDRSRVDIGATARERAVRIAVRDRGPGIPPQEQARLFRDFEKLNQAKPGTGLGLAITRRLAEAQGGSVGVESTPGMGSTFHLTFPVPAGDGQTPASPA